MIPDRGPRLVAAEATLFALSIVVAAGFSRLFDSGGWLLPLLAVATVCHLTGAVMRRAGVGVTLQVLATTLGTVLTMAWTQASDTLRLFLPTADTLAAFGTAFDEALTLYPEARAPTEPITGFVLAAMVGVAIIATMADIAAFRLGAEIQALVPPLTLFVFCSMLGSGEHQVVAALGFTVVALLFVLVMRAFTRRTTTTWLPGDAQRGPSALVRVGSGLTVAAALAATMVAPALPGADDDALWTWRGGDGPGTRFIISPLVDIRSRLVNQSSDVAFVVRSPEPSYWRMMALDTFDGETFGMNANFRPVSDTLGGTATGRADRITQQIEISALASPYLPAAFAPVRVDTGGEELRWDDRSSTLLLERDTAATGFTYTVESALPDFEPDTLRAAPDRVLPSIGERYLALPELDPRVVELAESIVADAASPYDRALALQNHLRAFEYSLTVPTGHSESALARFLFDDRAGYCEQFSTAFAAMARVVGLPSRVAVGFTVGEQSPSDREVYTVRGEHAHAWPEVWFSGVGWVPFEPTPGRGDPRSSEHTGVAPQQIGPTTTTTTSTTTPGDLPSTSFDPSLLPDFAEGLPGTSTGSTSSDGVPSQVVALATLVGVVAGWVLLVAASVWVRRWSRRRRAGDDPGRRVLAAWDEVVDAARSHRLVPATTDTHREFARRVVGALGDHDPAPLTRLAEQAAAARFGASPSIDPAVAVEASAGAVDALNQTRGRRQRLVDLVDLRRGLPRRRPAGSRRHATMSGAATPPSTATG